MGHNMARMVKRSGRGGARLGAGHPKGPIEALRRNRVSVLLTDSELAKLQSIAKEQHIPLGTAAYEIVARVLARR
jgi:hypothetical protein